MRFFGQFAFYFAVQEIFRDDSDGVQNEAYGEWLRGKEELTCNAVCNRKFAILSYAALDNLLLFT